MNSPKLAIGGVARRLVRSSGILCLLGLWLWAPVSAYASTVTIQPSTADTYLREDQANTNYGTDTTMFVQSRNSGRDRRSLVQFGLSAIPSGSSITSATLELYMTAAPSASRTYDIHRVTRSWVETQATWNRAVTGTNWTTAGGDFVAAPTASFTTGTVSGVWLTWDVTADVSAWYNGTASNYGFLIKDNAENSSTNYDSRLATRENGTAANQPKLVVSYIPPDLQITSMTVDPSVTSGDTVTVTMTVTNNGPVAVSDVTPSALTLSGTATKTYVSGPTPASVGSLASGASTSFTWTYTITGSVGQTYAFSGYAEANGGSLVTSTVTTNTGSIGNYSVSVDPLSVVAGSANVQLSFTVTNGLTSGTVDRVTVTNPNTSIWQSDGTWGANDTTGWSQTLQNNPTRYRFSSPGSASDIQANGGTKTFTVTFTLIGSPASDTNYTFPVDVRRRNGGTTTLNVYVTVRVPQLQVTLITVDSSVVSGGTVTVVMEVKNIGSTTLTDVTPSALTTGGTATKILTSGPTPASVSSLASDASTTFEWVYTITGSVGQTYNFTGNATANGGSVTATSATSNSGSIASYGVSVNPSAVTAGSANVQLAFTVTNNLTSGTLDRVTITNPNTAIWQSGGTWGNNDGSGWTQALLSSPTRYQFTSPAAGSDILANGGTKTFTVTFTLVADPGADTDYTFAVAVRRRNGGTTTLNVTVSVTRYTVTVTASPATIGADGQSTSTITATLTRGGAPQSGRNITFVTTSGTLSASSAVTNASGQATVTLTAPVSESDITATVTASYLSTAEATTTVTFQRVVLSVSASPGTIGADGQSTSTITVTLTQGGAALSGATVTLATTAGTLSATTLTTNGSGQATATITASVSETDVTATITATYRGHVKTTSVTFQRVVLTVSAAPGTIGADGQSTSTITVTLTQGGAALSGATVTLATTAGTLSATTLTTNGSGQATATLTASVSETDVTATITATYRGHVKTTTVTFQRVVLTISASPGTIGADGQSTSTITVTLTQGGAALSGATITLATTAGTLSATTLTTNGSGQATATLTASVSETDVTATETATYKGHVKTTSVTFQGVVLTISALPTSIPADGASTSTITVTLTQGGSAVSGATITLATTAGTLSATTLTTNGSGQATATLTSTSSATNVTATVTATYKGHVKTTSVLFGAIAISISASPGTIGADGQSTSTITVTLTYGGSPYSGQTVSLSTTAGTLSATSLTTNGSGQATATLTAPVSTTDSSATVTAQYQGPAFQAQTTVTFLGVVLSIAASPAEIDGDGEATTTLTITLTQGGSALSGATVTLATTDGTLSASSVTTNASGQATVTLTAPVSTINKSVTITATYKAVVTTASINIQGIALTITAAPPTIGADGQSTSTITITLTRAGNPYSGKTVTLSTTAGTLSATSVTTNGSGQATATLTSIVSETDVTATVTATYKSLSPTTTVTFQRVLLTISASPTSIPADGASTSTITVTLTQGGSAVSGATITLATTAGTLSATTLTTNGSGQATATLTSTSSATNVTATVTATYKGHVKTTTVTFLGVAISLSASPASIAADGVTTSTLTATLTAGGSGLSGKTVSFSTTAGNLSAGTAVTNGSGQATVTLTSSVSKTNVTATITASYIGSFNNTATVTFTGITINPAGYLAATAGNGQVTLYWENSTGYFTEALVVRKAGSAPAADPVDGTTYSVGGVLADGSEVIYKGTAATAAQTGLTNGTRYYYKAFTAYSSSSLYSTGTLLDVTPTAGGAGQPTWEYAVAGGNLQNGAVLDFTGGVYLSAGTRRFMGLQDSDGAHLWTPAQAQDTLLTGITWAPVSGTGFATAYLVGGDSTGQAYAVNPATGAILWQVTLPGAEALQALPMQQMWEYSDATYQAQYGPSVTDLVFFISRNSSTTNNRIYAVRLSDGAVVWEFNTGGGANVDGAIGSPVVDTSQNRIYVPTRAGAGGQSSLWTLSTLDGSLVGSLALGHIEASANVSYDWNTLYVGATGGTLYAVDLAGGAPAVRWSYASGGALTGFVWEDFYTPGLLYLATQDGNIVALQDSGTAAPPTPVWQTAIAGPSTPLLLDTTMVVGSSDGRLYEVRLSDGVITGSVVVGAGNAAVGDPATPDGITVVVGTTAGKLYRYTTPLP